MLITRSGSARGTPYCLRSAERADGAKVIIAAPVDWHDGRGPSRFRPAKARTQHLNIHVENCRKDVERLLDFYFRGRVATALSNS